MPDHSEPERDRVSEAGGDPGGGGTPHRRQDPCGREGGRAEGKQKHRRLEGTVHQDDVVPGAKQYG